MRKLASVIIVGILLLSMFCVLAPRVKAEGPSPIYINSDGNVVPSLAPISRLDNVTYAFTGNVTYPTYLGIVVKRSNITIDGKGYTVQGNQGGTGLNLTSIDNVTIKNTNIEDFDTGIYLESSSNNTVNMNNATKNHQFGIELISSSNSTISSNNATANNQYGIYLWSSSNNIISENSATANSYGIYLEYSSTNNAISGNNVTATGNGIYGIYLDSSSGNTVSGNIATANRDGIYLDSSSGNTVSGNDATANDDSGIYLSSSLDNTVSGNNATAKRWGIGLGSNSNNNTISGNNAENGIYGIYLSSSSRNTVSGNGATANLDGIYLDSSSGNTVSGNDATANGDSGIYLSYSSNNIISGNNAANDTYGIYLSSSSRNTVSGNNATANGNFGIQLVSSSANIIYHNNFMRNFAQASVDLASSFNSWNDTYPSGGNYWRDYADGTDSYSGPYQNVPGSDGICDTPYNVTIDARNIDYYPLTHLYIGLSVSILFLSSVTMDVNQSQLFTSNVQGIPFYSRQWYLNDTAILGATSASWTFTPQSSGSYTVYFNATDAETGNVTKSNTVPVSVNDLPSVTVQPGSATLDFGQYKRFTSIVSNGTVTYRYQWVLNGTAVPSATSFMWTFAPPSAGNYSVCLNVTDSVGAVATSNTVMVSVNQALSVSVETSSVIIPVGQSERFTSSVSGGTGAGTYGHYQWYLNGTLVPKETNPTWTYQFNSTGFYSVTLAVGDEVNNATSNPVQITVNPLLFVFVTPVAVYMDVGQSLLFSSNVSGGVLPRTYQWYLDSYPYSGATSNSWNFTSGSAGVYTIYLEVTDSFKMQATSNIVNVTVFVPGVLVHNAAVTDVTTCKIGCTTAAQGIPKINGLGIPVINNLNITVTAADVGNSTETFTLTLYANMTTVTSQNVTLSGGNSTTFNFSWNTTGAAYGNYPISAYATPVPGETNTSDNNFTAGVVQVTIPGDLNGDYKVTLQDLVILALAYGTKPGDQEWKPAADINNDGKVNLNDLVILAANYKTS